MSRWLAMVMWSSPAVPLTFTVIGLAVALPAARRSRQVDGDLRHVGSGADRSTVTVSAPPSAASWMAPTPLRVHGDVADVAEQPHPLAIGGDVEFLADVGAVEHQRVGAALAFDDVAAVAGIPDETVVAVAEQRRRRCRGRR